MDIKIGFFLLLLASFSSGWIIFKRRRSCSAKRCKVSSWGAWTTCSQSCGFFGVKERTRYKTASESCGGSCVPLKEQIGCNHICCPKPCVYKYSDWGKCEGCGVSGVQRRKPVLVKAEACGGSCAVPKVETRKCDTGRCCPVNCQMNNWGSWSSCSAACERTGVKKRHRSIKVSPSCNGLSCPTTSDTKACNGPCCRRNCGVSTWSSWGKCNAAAGVCGTNSGSQTRTRKVTTRQSCGGTCVSLRDSKKCTPVPITCKMSTWTSWSSCQPVSGNCGNGTKNRQRRILQQPYCSKRCGDLTDTKFCLHSCCPVNCSYTNWSDWSSCSNECGTGMQLRLRKVNVSSSCGGIACRQDLLKETRTCTKHIDLDCKLTTWSNWSLCSSGCGNGTVQRSRNITLQAKCRGKNCEVLIETRSCSSYRDRTHCQVGQWSVWGPCDTKCAIGSQKRVRQITTQPVCNGRACPAVQDVRSCGRINGGCEQVCSSGSCICRPGYVARNKTHCVGKNCGLLLMTYCPSGMTGSACKYPSVRCPGGSSVFPVTCTLECVSGYTLIGKNTVSCQTSGSWSPVQSYCKRNNNPPSDITLSQITVPENEGVGYTVGSLVTLDSNKNDTHTYQITRDRCKCFSIINNQLKTLKSFDFESVSNKFDITIRSTDNGIPNLSFEKTFQIQVLDVNEKPKDIILSNSAIDENTDNYTFVGFLQTMDDDQNQTFVYTLLDSANGLFTLAHNNRLLTSKGNKDCLAKPNPTNCPLNFEKSPKYQVAIMSTDNGSPPKTVMKTFDITLRDMNDPPFNITLSATSVNESAPKNTLIGQFSSQDEDATQRLNYKLTNDDGGNFFVTNTGLLYKAKPPDYETTSDHTIEVEVSDNGIVQQKTTQGFVIDVIDANEPPVKIKLLSASPSFIAVNDTLTVPENTTCNMMVGQIEIYDEDLVSSLNVKIESSHGQTIDVGTNQVQCQNISKFGAKSKCTTALYLKKELNFEVKDSYKLVLKITDRGHVALYTFVVKVSDSNDKPTDILLDNADYVTVYENQVGVNIGSMSTTDEDLGQSYTYKLLDNMDMFEIKSTMFKFKDGAFANYEKQSIYHVKIQSTDNGNPPKSTEDVIVINIADVNDLPTSVSLSNSAVYENASIGHIVGVLNIIDEDTINANTTTHPCHVANSSLFLIENNILKVNSQLDHESASVISVVVTCVDRSLVGNWTIQVFVRDVNEAPYGIILSNSRIAENADIPTLIGVLSAIDPDNEFVTRQSFNYTILTNNDFFKTVGDKLFATTQFNFETLTSIDVDIRVTDSGVPAKSYTELKIITIEDVNDRPTDVIMLNNVVDENSAVDTVIGVLDTSDEDNNQNHKYRLIDSSDARFKIIGNTLMVSEDNTKCLGKGGGYCRLNFEKTQQLSISVIATDNGSPELSLTKNLTIYLRDINDKPYNLSLSGHTLREDAAVGYIIGRLTANDDDSSQLLSFKITGGPKDHFYIDDKSNLRKKSNFSDFETQSLYRLSIEAKDNGWPPQKTSANFTIEVLDVNEAPISTLIKDDAAQHTYNESNPHVEENSPAGTVVGTIFSFDEDFSAKLDIKLDDDCNGTFALHAETICVNSTGKIKTICKRKLLTNMLLNYEEKSLYTILVRSTDQGGLRHVQEFKVSIIDVNDAPSDVLLSGKRVASIQENIAGAYIADISTVDDDQGQTFSYQIQGPESIFFEIRHSNKLHMKDSVAFDFEQVASYNISINSTDSGSPRKSVLAVLPVIIEDINERPSIGTFPDLKVKENSLAGTIIGTIDIRDPDNLGQNTYKQVHSCYVDHTHSMFNVTSHKTHGGLGRTHYLCVTNNKLDYEKATSYNITVKCEDSGSPKLSTKRSLVIRVKDVNEAPMNIKISSGNIDENVQPQVVGILNTVDPDNFGHAARQSFTYTLLNQTVPFVINGDKLATTVSLDYEMKPSYDLLIKSVDNGFPSLSFQTMIKISVVDVNEAPIEIILSNNTVAENSKKGTMIGSLSVIDDDRSNLGEKQQHTYSLSANPFGMFRIAGNILQVAEDNTLCLQLGGAHCKLNFESNRFLKITIDVTDDGTPAKSFQKKFDIIVTNANDKPRNLRLSSNVVAENASIGFEIGKLSVEDEDVGQKHIFSLADDDKGRFIITNNSVIKAKPTNYESKQSHKIVVTATDDGMPSITIKKEIHIIIQNINESPTNLRLTSLKASQSFPENQPKVKENMPNGTVVATVEADDQDAVERLTFQLLENPDGKFRLDNKVVCTNISTGIGQHTLCRTNLLVNSTLDFEEEAVILISIRVSDPAGLSHVASFNITLLDGNDAPTDVTIQGEHLCFVQENLKYKRIGVLETIDQDPFQDFTYKIIDSAGNRFAIQKDLFGVYELFTTDTILDYESQTNYTIVVETTDNGRPAMSHQGSIIVQVIDINEAPTDIKLSLNHAKENTPNNTFVCNITVTDPDNKHTIIQSHTCEINQVGSKLFRLSQNQLFVNGALDHESKSTVAISILCIDSGFPRKSFEKDVIMYIDDVNEPPTGLSLTSGTAPENKDNYIIGTFIVHDPDLNGNNHTLTLVNPTVPFVIDGLILKTSQNLNYEKRNSYSIDVNVKDVPGSSYTEAFQITVEDRNDTPNDLKCSGSFTISEKANRGAHIGRCTAVDEDRYQTHAYNITGVSFQHALAYYSMLHPISRQSPFRIERTTGLITLQSSSTINPGIFTVTIAATDDGIPQLTLRQNVSIYVTNVNERPTNIIMRNNKIQENAPYGSVVGSLLVEDPDNRHQHIQNHSCVVKGRASPFEINSRNQLIVKHPQMLDFEKTTFFDTLVKCTEENGGFSIQKKFVINILNVNEPPQNISLTPSSIDEHNKINEVVGVITFTDPDNLNVLNDNVSISKFTSFGAPFQLRPPFSLVATQVLDHEKESSFTVQVTLQDDGKPPKFNMQNIKILVNDLNDAPTDIILSATTLEEDILSGSIVANLSTLDHDQNQQHTYKFQDDAGLFSISGNQITLNGKLNYEAFKSVDIVVQTTDNGSPPLSFQKSFTLLVADANDKPDFVSKTILPVPENTRSDFKIANLCVNDEDDFQLHTCICISSNKDWILLFTEESGNVSVYINSSSIHLDFEALQILKFEVRCFDDGVPKLSIDTTLEVPVLDINEAPYGIKINNSSFVFLNENPIAGEDVGILQCLDPDLGQAYSYEVLGESKKYFKVSPSSNELSIINLPQLNYEAPPGVNQIVVDLRVTDNGQPPLSYKANITIIAKDVNEPPTNVTIIHGSRNIKEDTKIKKLGELWSHNPEGIRQLVTFKLLNYQHVFKIVTTHAPASTSYLYLNSDLEADITSSYVLSIQATDNGKPPLSTMGVISFNILKSNPCVTNNVTCLKNAVCKRVKKLESKCICLPGFALRDNVYAPIDDCFPQCRFCIGTKQKECADSKSEPCSPCQNGGMCTDLHLNYTCQCKPGYSGHDCSVNIDDCKPNPCLQNSTCYDGIKNYTCECAHGFRGRTCAVDIDECESKPCFKGACTDLINGYKCACPTGFHGSSCERNSTGCSGNTCGKQQLCTTIDLSSKSKGVASWRCVPNDETVTLSFPTWFAPLSGNAMILWKLHFEDFLRNTLTIPLPWIQPKSKYKDVKLSDSTILSYGPGVKKAVNYADDAKTDVKFYGVYKDKVLSPNVLLYSINETCEELFVDCTLQNNQFGCHVCSVVELYLKNSKNIKKPVISQYTFNSDPTYMTALPIAGIVLCVLIIFIVVVFIFRSRRNNRKRKLDITMSGKTAKRGKHLETLEKRSSLYNEYDMDNFDGHFNPIYGVDEDEVDNEATTVNPLYDNSRPEDLFSSTTEIRTNGANMFENPLYGVTGIEGNYLETAMDDVNASSEGIINPFFENQNIEIL